MNKHIFLVFYKVSNDFDYERHTFDLDEGLDTMCKLLILDSEQCRIYCLTKECQWCLNLKDLELDYNDEILDGGWWCKEVILFNNEIITIEDTML